MRTAHYSLCRCRRRPRMRSRGVDGSGGAEARHEHVLAVACGLLRLPFGKRARTARGPDLARHALGGMTPARTPPEKVISGSFRRWAHLGSNQCVDNCRHFLRSPLLEQRLSVREHERRDGALGDHGAPHHCLAASGWSHQHASVMGEHLGHGGRLLRRQGAVELELRAGVCWSPVVGDQPAACVLDGRLDLFEQPRGMCKCVGSSS